MISCHCWISELLSLNIKQSETLYHINCELWHKTRVIHDKILTQTSINSLIYISDRVWMLIISFKTVKKTSLSSSFSSSAWKLVSTMLADVSLSSKSSKFIMNHITASIKIEVQQNNKILQSMLSIWKSILMKTAEKKWVEKIHIIDFRKYFSILKCQNVLKRLHQCIILLSYSWSQQRWELHMITMSDHTMTRNQSLYDMFWSI